MKSEVGAGVVPAGAEVDEGLPPPKPGNRLGVGVEEEVGLLPLKPENRLGVGVEVEAGAVELGAALEVGVEENIPPKGVAVEPAVLVEVVDAGFPKSPPGFWACVLGVVLAPPNMLGVTGVDDPAGFCPNRPLV